MKQEHLQNHYLKLVKLMFLTLLLFECLITKFEINVILLTRLYSQHFSTSNIFFIWKLWILSNACYFIYFIKFFRLLCWKILLLTLHCKICYKNHFFKWKISEKFYIKKLKRQPKFLHFRWHEMQIHVSNSEIASILIIAN